MRVTKKNMRRNLMLATLLCANGLSLELAAASTSDYQLSVQPFDTETPLPPYVDLSDDNGSFSKLDAALAALLENNQGAFRKALIKLIADSIKSSETDPSVAVKNMIADSFNSSDDPIAQGLAAVLDSTNYSDNDLPTKAIAAIFDNSDDKIAKGMAKVLVSRDYSANTLPTPASIDMLYQTVKQNIPQKIKFNTIPFENMVIDIWNDLVSSIDSGESEFNDQNSLKNAILASISRAASAPNDGTSFDYFITSPSVIEDAVKPTATYAAEEGTLTSLSDMLGQGVAEQFEARVKLLLIQILQNASAVGYLNYDLSGTTPSIMDGLSNTFARMSDPIAKSFAHVINPSFYTDYPSPAATVENLTGLALLPTDYLFAKTDVLTIMDDAAIGVGIQTNQAYTDLKNSEQFGGDLIAASTILINLMDTNTGRSLLYNGVNDDAQFKNFQNAVVSGLVRLYNQQKIANAINPTSGDTDLSVAVFNLMARQLESVTEQFISSTLTINATNLAAMFDNAWTLTSPSIIDEEAGNDVNTTAKVKALIETALKDLVPNESASIFDILNKIAGDYGYGSPSENLSQLIGMDSVRRLNSYMQIAIMQQLQNQAVANAINPNANPQETNPQRAVWDSVAARLVHLNTDSIANGLAGMLLQSDNISALTSQEISALRTASLPTAAVAQEINPGADPQETNPQRAVWDSVAARLVHLNTDSIANGLAGMLLQSDNISALTSQEISALRTASLPTAAVANAINPNANPQETDPQRAVWDSVAARLVHLNTDSIANGLAGMLLQSDNISALTSQEISALRTASLPIAAVAQSILNENIIVTQDKANINAVIDSVMNNYPSSTLSTSGSIIDVSTLIVAMKASIDVNNLPKKADELKTAVASLNNGSNGSGGSSVKLSDIVTTQSDVTAINSALEIAFNSITTPITLDKLKTAIDSAMIVYKPFITSGSIIDVSTLIVAMKAAVNVYIQGCNNSPVTINGILSSINTLKNGSNGSGGSSVNLSNIITDPNGVSYIKNALTTQLAKLSPQTAVIQRMQIGSQLPSGDVGNIIATAWGAKVLNPYTDHSGEYNTIMNLYNALTVNGVVDGLKVLLIVDPSYQITATVNNHVFTKSISDFIGTTDALAFYNAVREGLIAYTNALNVASSFSAKDSTQTGIKAVNKVVADQLVNDRTDTLAQGLAGILDPDDYYQLNHGPRYEAPMAAVAYELSYAGETNYTGLTLDINKDKLSSLIMNAFTKSGITKLNNYSGSGFEQNDLNFLAGAIADKAYRYTSCFISHLFAAVEDTVAYSKGSGSGRALSELIDSNFMPLFRQNVKLAVNQLVQIQGVANAINPGANPQETDPQRAVWDSVAARLVHLNTDSIANGLAGMLLQSDNISALTSQEISALTTANFPMAAVANAIKTDEQNLGRTVLNKVAEKLVNGDRSDALAKGLAGILDPQDYYKQNYGPRYEAPMAAVANAINPNANPQETNPQRAVWDSVAARLVHLNTDSIANGLAGMLLQSDNISALTSQEISALTTANFPMAAVANAIKSGETDPSVAVKNLVAGELADVALDPIQTAILARVDDAVKNLTSDGIRADILSAVDSRISAHDSKPNVHAAAVSTSGSIGNALEVAASEAVTYAGLYNAVVQNANNNATTLYNNIMTALKGNFALSSDQLAAIKAAIDAYKPS